MAVQVALRAGLVGPRQARARLRDILAAAGHEVVAEGQAVEELDAGQLDVFVVAASEAITVLPAQGVPPVLAGGVVGPFATLSARATVEQLEAAVLAVAAGLRVTDPAGPGEAAPAWRETPEALTAREREVLVLIADGLPNKAIARGLGISENTVKYHVAAILAKLDAQSRADAVMRAARAGLLPL